MTAKQRFTFFLKGGVCELGVMAAGYMAMMGFRRQPEGPTGRPALRVVGPTSPLNLPKEPDHASA